MPEVSHRDERVSTAPGLSPGVVEDGETVLREMFNPEHVRDGEVIERAVPVDDLRHRGFSVHRMRYVAPAFIKSSMERRVAKARKGDTWREEGVAKIGVRAVRDLSIDGEQALVVIDTATDENRGHASILTANEGAGRGQARKLRERLLPLLRQRMPVDAAYGSEAI